MNLGTEAASSTDSDDDLSMDRSYHEGTRILIDPFFKKEVAGLKETFKTAPCLAIT